VKRACPGTLSAFPCWTFAALAILLAGAGGLQRDLVPNVNAQREIGIREAMGAQTIRRHPNGDGQTTMLILLGVPIGLEARGYSPLFRTMLYAVSELDVATFAFIPVMVTVIVLIASLWSRATGHASRSYVSPA